MEKRRKRIRVNLWIALLIVGVIGYGLFVWKVQVGAGDEDVVQLKEGCTVADIQRALNRNSVSQRMHLTVKIPAGTYSLDKTLYVYSNTTVLVDENATFVLTSDKYKVMLSSYNYQYDKGGYEHIQNVEIDGGTWDGNGISGEMIRFIHGKNITVKNVTIQNVSGGAHQITFAGVQNGLIENCHLGDFKGKYSAVKEAIHLDVVHSKSLVPGTVTYDDTPNENIVIRGNTIENYPRAIGSHSFVKGVYQKNITITGNTFRNISEEAVNIYGYVNCQVTNNTMEEVGTGIRIYTLLPTGKQLTALSATKVEEVPDSYDIVLKGNDIKSAKKYGIQLYGNQEQPMKGVTIIGNTIEKTKDNGIMLYMYSVGNIVKGNQIAEAGNQGIGIYQFSSYNKVRNNQIKKANSHGIYVADSKGTLIKGNTISKSGKHGIWLAKDSHYTKIVQNKVVQSKEIGIGMIDCNGNVITNNTVVGASKFAFYSRRCKKMTYTGNEYKKITGKEEYIVTE